MKPILITMLMLHSLVALSKNPPIDINKIMASGNGKSIQTAYKVNTVDEEYDLLRHLKLTSILQKHRAFAFKNF